MLRNKRMKRELANPVSILTNNRQDFGHKDHNAEIRRKQILLMAEADINDSFDRTLQD